jgi:hypothetical protein
MDVRSVELGQEYPLPDEPALIAEIADLTLRAAKFIFVTSPTSRRLPHHKSHGCVDAVFKVRDDLPSNLSGGVLKPGATYKAKVRFSNGDVKPRQPDSLPDIRGMAIKLFISEDQNSTLEMPPPPLTQDFVLASDKAFFSRDLRDFLAFTQAMTVYKGIDRHFEKYRDLGEIYYRSQISTTDVLQLQYYSQLPYRLGEDGPAVKFSARPASEPLPGVSESPMDFLRENLANSLMQREAVFDFLVQRQVNADTMPVEDGSVTWPEDAASGGTRFEKVATITILKLPLDETGKPILGDGENLSFNPWNGLDPNIADAEEAARKHPHRPLGAANRARRAIYGNAFKIRMQQKTQDPFTGIMTLKDPIKGPAQLVEILKNNGLVNAFALHRLGFVHFARFLILLDPPPPAVPEVARFVIATTFDFDFRDYVQAFVDEIGDVFDELLELMKDAPPRPVREHREEFLKYVKEISKARPVLFYSSYPDLSVQNILTLEKKRHA